MVRQPPVRVLFVHQSSELYGSDKVLLYALTGLVARGAVVPQVLLPERGPLFDRLALAGIEVRVAEVAKLSRKSFTPRGFFGLLRALRASVSDFNSLMHERPPDVVHSNTLAVLAGAAWARLKGVPHVWHVHEIILSPGVVSRAFPWLVRVGSNRVVVNSNRTAHWLLAHQPALALKTDVVFNGLPAMETPRPIDVAKFRQLAGAGPGDVLVTLAGRLNHWKGQGLLIDAVARLRQQGRSTGLRVAIVGDAASGSTINWGNALRAQAAAARLADVVVFMPFTNDMSALWSASDIAVVPSTEPEPFGMVAIEAMQAGLPVVAAAHGGLLDIVVHQETGLLVEPRNADALAEGIATLVQDEPLRSRMGAAGRQRQHMLFSVDQQVVALERLYMQMAGRLTNGPQGCS